MLRLDRRFIVRVLALESRKRLRPVHYDKTQEQRKLHSFPPPFLSSRRSFLCLAHHRSTSSTPRLHRSSLLPYLPFTSNVKGNSLLISLGPRFDVPPAWSSGPLAGLRIDTILVSIFPQESPVPSTLICWSIYSSLKLIDSFPTTLVVPLLPYATGFTSAVSRAVPWRWEAIVCD